MGLSINGGTPKFIRENPIKMDDLGVPLFQEITISGHFQKGFFFLVDISHVRFRVAVSHGPWMAGGDCSGATG